MKKLLLLSPFTTLPATPHPPKKNPSCPPRVISFVESEEWRKLQGSSDFRITPLWAGMRGGDHRLNQSQKECLGEEEKMPPSPHPPTLRLPQLWGGHLSWATHQREPWQNLWPLHHEVWHPGSQWKERFQGT